MTNLFLSWEFINDLAKIDYHVRDYVFPMVPDDRLVVFLPKPHDGWAVCLHINSAEGEAQGVLVFPLKKPYAPVKMLPFRWDESGFYTKAGRTKIDRASYVSAIGTAVAAVIQINAGKAIYGEKTALPEIERRIARKCGEETGDAYHVLSLRSKDYLPETGKECQETGIKMRYHQCRGHWRNHPAGKRIWVRAHYRGDKALGMVHKDYSA